MFQAYNVTNLEKHLEVCQPSGISTGIKYNNLKVKENKMENIQLSLNEEDTEEFNNIYVSAEIKKNIE